MRIHSLLYVATLLASTLNAQGMNVSMGTLTFGGSGCSSLTSVLSPDGSALSLLFDAFAASVDGSTPTARANCELSIPVNIPVGRHVSLVGGDYRGFNSLPVGASSTLSVAYFLSGAATGLNNFSFAGPLTEDYFSQQDVRPSNQPSNCSKGASVLRVSASLTVKANVAGEQASATLDSLDLVINDLGRDGGIVISLTYPTCAPHNAGAGARLLVASGLGYLLAVSSFLMVL